MTCYTNAVNNQQKLKLQNCRDTAVGIMIRYKLDSPRIEFQEGPDFLHLSRVALGPIQSSTQWVTPHSHWVKQLENDVNHPLPSSIKVNERVQRYLCSPSVPSWQVIGPTFTLH
jgi:hypothetical protein